MASHLGFSRSAVVIIAVDGARSAITDALATKSRIQQALCRGTQAEHRASFRLRSDRAEVAIPQL